VTVLKKRSSIVNYCKWFKICGQSYLFTLIAFRRRLNNWMGACCYWCILHQIFITRFHQCRLTLISRIRDFWNYRLTFRIRKRRRVNWTEIKVNLRWWKRTLENFNLLETTCTVECTAVSDRLKFLFSILYLFFWRAISHSIIGSVERILIVINQIYFFFFYHDIHWFV